MSLPLAVRKISQKNNHVFEIEWSDGVVQDFLLSDLQKACPCAQCTDEVSGRSLVDPSMISDDVRALFIRSVGRYGLRIQYTSGCSTGIYSFDRLRKMKGEKC